jgi:hypothetical protein
MQAEAFPEGYPASAFVVYQISAQVGRGFAGRFDFPDAPQLTTLGEDIAKGQTGSGTSNFPANTVIGTITFAIGVSAGTFATAGGGAETFAAGDRLAIINQNPADATLADLSITFLGKRT